MTMEQVFVSFADGRNLNNAMDKSSDSSVSMVDVAHQDAVQKEPLMSSATFDFQHYQYKPPTLLQQIVIYMRIKASARYSSVTLTVMCVRARTHARTHAHTHTRTHTRTHAYTRTHARTHTHARARAQQSFSFVCFDATTLTSLL